MKHTFQKHSKAIVTAITACLMLLQLISCSNTSKSYTAVCITHFGFDSFPAFSSYTFYIDNFAHKIYNTDSFPFRSKVDSLYPTITAGSDNGTFTMNGKTWASKDTMDFSNCPIQMTFTDESGSNSYTYNIYVNIHRLDPDSLQMRRIATLPVQGEYRIIRAGGEFAMLENNGSGTSLYTSSDCINWAGPTSVNIPVAPGTTILIKSLSYLGKTAFMIDKAGGLYTSSLADQGGDLSVDGLQDWTKVEGAPYVTTLLGILEGRTYPAAAPDSDALLAIVKEGSTLHHARFNGYWSTGQPAQNGAWHCNKSEISENFPVKSFACSDEYTSTGWHYVTLSGGINSNDKYCNATWSTMSSSVQSSEDSVYWALISTDTTVIGEVEDASTFYYDDRLFMFGGKRLDAGKKLVQDNTLYVSSDQGLNWNVADSRLAFRVFNSSANCSQIISDPLYIWVFSGMDGVNGVWKGYINKMLFDE